MPPDGYPNSLHADQLLTGTDGTILIELQGLFGELPAPTADGTGEWVVMRATGAYAGLHGHGTWSGFADFRDALAHTGPPTVAFTLDGQLG